MDSYEEFKTDPVSLSFVDLLDNIMNDIHFHHKNKIKRLKIKIITMLNSNAQHHNVPHRHIEKLSSTCDYNATADIFNYFSRYIKRDSPEVLRLIIEASGCSKARDLYENYFNICI